GDIPMMRNLISVSRLFVANKPRGIQQQRGRLTAPDLGRFLARADRPPTAEFLQETPIKIQTANREPMRRFVRQMMDLTPFTHDDGAGAAAGKNQLLAARMLNQQAGQPIR